MKANELRIGNYVTWADDDELKSTLTIIGIVLNDSIWLEWEWSDGTSDTTDCGITSIKPIPLTEEWLLKFGFKEWKAIVNMGVVGQPMCGWRNGKFVINSAGKRGFTLDSNVGLESFCFKYIHQLQNLYFALTGQELIINNKS